MSPKPKREQSEEITKALAVILEDHRVSVADAARAFGCSEQGVYKYWSERMQPRWDIGLNIVNLALRLKGKRPLDIMRRLED